MLNYNVIEKMLDEHGQAIIVPQDNNISVKEELQERYPRPRFEIELDCAGDIVITDHSW